MIIIDGLKESDPPKLAELDKRCFVIPWSEKMFAEELNNSLANYVIARDGDRIAGYAGFWEISGVADITNVAVDIDYRRQHIGSRIMEAMIKKAAGMKLNSLTLEVRASNLAAQGLYKKYGFINIGTRKGYYRDNKEDAIIMARGIDADE